MIPFGTLLNILLVLIGSTIGLLFKKIISPTANKKIFFLIGLFTLGLGFSMVIQCLDYYLLLISILLGTIIGYEIKFNFYLNNLIKKMNTKDDNFSKGLITSFLLFCVGSMTIVGAIKEGLGEPPILIYTKSVMDGISSIILASVFGIGVMFSVVPMLIFQGGITVFVFYFKNFIPDELIGHIGSVGGVLIIVMGIDILGYKRLKTINMLPSLLLVVLYWWVSN